MQVSGGEGGRFDLLWGVGTVQDRAGAHVWLVCKNHSVTARQGRWVPARLESTSPPVSAVGVQFDAFGQGRGGY